MFEKGILLLCFLLCQWATPSCSSAEFVTCDYNGTIYDVDTSFEVDMCNSAYCNSDGSVKVTYTCCVVNNETYQSYTAFKIDLCTKGYCDNGYLYREKEMCEELSCKGAYRVEGKCCEKCPDDHVPSCDDGNGKVYEIGPVPNESGNPCESCECEFGWQSNL